MAEQLPIDGQAWEAFDDREYFDNQETVPPWVGVEDYEDIDWSQYSYEQIEEFCSFLQRRKGFLNGVHQGAIDERIRRDKARIEQLGLGEQQFRPDPQHDIVMRRRAEMRREFWERHK